MFAGAAFTDEADFDVETNVVNTLVGLGVIDGYADGSFKPEGTVTRAEMAKMIYVIRTGRSDASAYNDDKTSFTDIGDHWARGYIKYCQALGIISGKSTTKFDPNGKVTTAEAAKMLLVTLGYNAQKAGLEGSMWSQKTVALADENGLLKDVDCGTSAAAPRQYAAQLMYNTIFAPTVVLRDGEYTNLSYDGKTKNATVGSKYMDLESEYGALTAISFNDAKSEYNYKIGIDKYVSANDYSDLFGMNVQVLFKEDRNSDKVVYGISEYDSDVMVSGVIGDIKDFDKVNFASDSKIEVNGTEYKIANPDIYAFNVDTNVKASELKDVDGYKAFNFKAIDNGEDNKIDLIVYSPVTVEKVTFVNNTKFSTNGSFTNKKLEDVAAYEGMAKDDYVVVTKAENTTDATAVLEKATMVTGKINGIKNGSVKIDGTWYDAAKSNLFDGKTNGSTVEMAVIGTVAFSCETSSVSVATSDVVYIEKAAKEDASGLSSDKLMAKIVKADGTIVEAEVSMVDDKKVVATGAGADEVAIAAAKTKIEGMLCSFSMDGAKYELTVLDSDDEAGYDKYVDAGSYDKDDATLAGFDIADDSVIFVKEKNEDTKVITGKTMKGWGTTAINSVRALTIEASSSFQTVAVAAITVNSMPASGDTLYGYVVADPYTTKVDGTNYANYSIWTVDGLKDYMVKENTPSKAKEDLVAFNMKGDKEIEFTSGNDAIDPTSGAVMAATDSRVQIKTAAGTDTYKITEDTVIVYIDDENVEGVEGGSIVLAQQDASNGKYFVNVKFDYNDDKELTYVFVAVNGQFDDDTI